MTREQGVFICPRNPGCVVVDIAFIDPEQVQEAAHLLKEQASEKWKEKEVNLGEFDAKMGTAIILFKLGDKADELLEQYKQNAEENRKDRTVGGED